MVQIEKYALALVDKKENIIGIARPVYGNFLVFTTLTEEYEKNKEIALFGSEQEAKRSFTGRISKTSYRLTENLAKLITEEYDMKTVLYGGCSNFIRIKEFSDIKSIFRPVKINVSYEFLE